jgi:hypothetical protein
MIISLLLLQAAAQQAPDIELNVRARARSVEIEQKGEAKLEVRGGEGSRVEARVAPKAEGRTRLRNVTVDVRAEARLDEGVEIRAEAETGTPQ